MKMFAPNMVHITIPVALIVFTDASTSSLQGMRPLILAMIQAPRQPTPAASVGAATPITIVPRTRKIRIAPGMIGIATRKRPFQSRRSSLGTGGPIFGLM